MPVRLLVRRSLLVLGLLLLLVVVWTVLALLAARGDLQQAERALRQIPDSADLAAADASLADAGAALSRADGLLSMPGPVLGSHLPYVGRTPRAVRTTVSATLAVTTGARDVLAVLPGVSQSTNTAPLITDGRVDLTTLSTLQTAVRAAAGRTSGPVSELSHLDTSGVPGSVAAGVHEAQGRLDAVPAALFSGADALQALGGILGGDRQRQLLILLENNAELRGTGGLVSVFAQVQSRDGALTIGPFSDVDGVAAAGADAVSVDAPADYRALWGPFKANSKLWKNVNMSPDVPTSSLVLSRVADKSLGTRPDAMVWLDVRTIAEVIGATGGATLPDGTELTADNTVSQLLSQAYANVQDNEREQGLRRLRLRAAADIFLERLTTGKPDLAALGPALARAVMGRHLTLWSHDPVELSSLQGASLAGSLDGPVDRGTGDATAGSVRYDDLAAVSVNNFGDGAKDGNKLDFYSRRQLDVSVAVSEDSALVEQRFALRNTAPARGLPLYVAGRNAPGVSNNYVSFALPAQAEVESFSREGSELSRNLLSEGRHQVLTDGAQLSPGTTATWTLRYRIPLTGGRYRLRLVPQPLAVDGGLSIRVSGADDPLTADPGSILKPEESGTFTASGPFDRVENVEIGIAHGGFLHRVTDRFRRFLDEPVQLP